LREVGNEKKLIKNTETMKKNVEGKKNGEERKHDKGQDDMRNEFQRR
jgi:hypothetical protein